MDEGLLQALHDEIERLKARVEEVEGSASHRSRWVAVVRGWLASPRARWAALAAVLVVPAAAYASVVVPHVFVNGTVADADEVNANFTALENEINLHETISDAHHAKTTSASELTSGVLADGLLSPAVSLLGSSISVTELDFDPSTQAELDAHTAVFGLHATDPAAHHARYADAEAIAAVGPHVGSVDGLAGGTITGAITVDGLISSATGGFRFPDATVQTTAATGGAGVPNRIIVAKSGGDFKLIQDAIDSVTPTQANPYLIEIGPGVYPEDLVLKSYLHLRGAGIGGTVITPVAGTQHVTATGLSGVKLSQLTLYDDVTVGPVVSAGIRAEGSSLELVDVRLEGYRTWQILSESGSSLQVRRSEFASTQAQHGISALDSDAFVSDSRFDVQRCGVDVSNGSLVLTGSQLQAIADIYDVCVDNATAPFPAVIHLGGNTLWNGVLAANFSDLRITGNEIGGAVFLAGSGSSEIVGNRIGFLNTPAGDPAISAEGLARIVGNTVVGGSAGGIFVKDVASVTGNRVSCGGGGVGIINGGTATIVSNSVSGGSVGILDQGVAMVLGNDVEGSTLGLDVASAAVPTVVVGNRISGTTGPEPPERFVSDREVRIESTDEGVLLVAGGSTVTVAPNGDVTIDAANNLTLTAAGDLELSGNIVRIDATTNMELAAGTFKVDTSGDLDLNAGAILDMRGAGVTLDAGSQANLNASGQMNLTAPLINLN